MFITPVRSAVVGLRTTFYTVVHFASGMSFTLPECQLIRTNWHSKIEDAFFRMLVLTN
jgi:hypothetical protein